MKCPFCGADDTKVADSRHSEDHTAIRRRRECIKCGKRFTTYEKLEYYPLMVIKKDQNRETFSRDKIKQGVYMACHKRPVSVSQLDNLVNEVENAIYARDTAEVTSAEIGELVMEKLRKLDEVAYVRFASVYRSFTDVETFAAEISKLKGEK